jgi:hypothetical protein
MRASGRKVYLVDLTGIAGTVCFNIEALAIRRKRDALSGIEL